MIENEGEQPKSADRPDHERSEKTVVTAPQGGGHAQLNPECEVVDRFDLSRRVGRHAGTFLVELQIWEQDLDSLGGESPVIGRIAMDLPGKGHTDERRAARLKELVRFSLILNGWLSAQGR